MLICKIDEVSSYMYLFSLLYVLFSNRADLHKKHRLSMKCDLSVN